MIWLVQHGLYMPLLIVCGAAVVYWVIKNSEDIDPGPPNARVGARR